MTHELVEYRGNPVWLEEVIRKGDLNDLYPERDRLNSTSSSLTEVRYGVRPVSEDLAVVRDPGTGAL